MGALVGLRVPPPANEDEFEEITLVAARLRWPGSDFERNGTRGQRQNGVDIIGDDGTSRIAGIQCRNLEKKTTYAMVATAVKDAEIFKPTLEVFYYACVGKRDAKLQAQVRELSSARKKAGRFTVGLLFWPDIWNDLSLDPRQVAKFFPQFVAFDSLPDGIKPSIQSKLQEKFWEARYRAYLDLSSLVAGLLEGVPEHIDEWGDACEFLAMDFPSIARQLGQLLKQYGGLLSKEIRELIENAAQISQEGSKELSYGDNGAPEVSGKGRDLAAKLYDALHFAKEASLTELNKAAGMK